MKNANQKTTTARLKVSPGNSKLGAIPSVSFPPVVTCAEGVPCVRDCYACKLCRIYANVRDSYRENLEYYRTDPDGFFTELKAHLTLNRYFRMFVSGDFPDFGFLVRFMRTATACPGCIILVFTKRYKWVNDYITECGNIPENVRLILSGWDEWQPENPYNLPQSQVIFRGQTPPDTWKICGGNCTDCICRGVGCWELKKGETIAFYKH